MSGARMRLAVLGSGEGTNFEALVRAAGAHYEVVAAGSDRPAATMLERARRHGIPAFCVPPRDYPQRAAHDVALAEALAEFEPDLVALAGYMRILGPAVLAAWQGRLLNIHPSLLPAFAGLDTHARALAAGAENHGATVHFVTRELDAGPRILQGRLRVGTGATAARLARRVSALEHRIYPLAVDWCATGRVRMESGTVRFDGRALREPLVLEEDECT